MVFAEDKPVRIFGTGIGPVSATFRGRTAKAVSSGRVWTVEFLREMPPFGLSYMHLQTLAEGLDASGASFRSFRAVRRTDEMWYNSRPRTF